MALSRAVTLSRTAAGIEWVLGLGFGLPAVYGTVHFARYGEVWYLAGFPSYGDGPFEMAYWIGFALPFGPPLGVVRTIAVLVVVRYPVVDGIRGGRA